MKVALMVTCLGDNIRPQVGQATVRLLRRLGHEVNFPLDQTCCGQPMFNSGFAEMARAQARHTIEVFEQEDLPIVVPSGSCAAMVKVEYLHLFAEDPEWHARASALADRTYELAGFLVNKLGVVDVGARFDGSVTYHPACHLRVLGAGDEAEQLIRHVAGATYLPLPVSDQCCGFGGSFAVRYGNISTAMVDNKVGCVAQTAADALVSTDAGCLMNIGGRLHRLGRETQVLHLAELLERTGDQRP